MRSRFRSASPRRSATARASMSGPRRSSSSAMRSRAFSSRFCSSFCFAAARFWQIFPLRGLTSENWSQLSLLGKIADYFWHITLPVVSMTLGAFATVTFLTKNSFLDEIPKQYVQTARMKGLSEQRVLYGHVFRNAMMIVVSGFPGAFIAAFFGGSLLIETIFSLDGLGLLSFEFDRQSRLSGRFRRSLYFRVARSCRESPFRLDLHVDRSAHRFRDAGGLDCASLRQSDEPSVAAKRSRRRLAGRGHSFNPDQPAPSREFRKPTNAAIGHSGFFFSFSSCRCSPNSSPTISRSSSSTRANICCRSCMIIRKRNSAAFSRKPIIATE